jgi:hypothetical protein
MVGEPPVVPVNAGFLAGPQIGLSEQYVFYEQFERRQRAAETEGVSRRFVETCHPCFFLPVHPLVIEVAAPVRTGANIKLILLLGVS